MSLLDLIYVRSTYIPLITWFMIWFDQDTSALIHGCTPYTLFTYPFASSPFLSFSCCGLLIYRKLWYATKGYLYQGTDWLKSPKGRAIYPMDIARYIALELPGRVPSIFYATSMSGVHPSLLHILCTTKPVVL